MRPIPKKMRDEMSSDPFYSKCCISNSECSGRITWEHAQIWGGRQINEIWAILPICVYHHLGKGLDKNLNKYCSLLLATSEDLQKYPRRDWEQELRYLHQMYYDSPRISFFKQWCAINNKVIRG